ncbi:MAG TPA: hypothetical protein VIN08_07085 [Ohtaekwangia sp.]|uniref:hypothetical protein n=1 Tax=Ohtaekwangia sp. TaxID=2066019 RepID=UPI002F94F7F4
MKSLIAVKIEIIPCLSLLVLTSCTSYYLTTESLKSQFNGADSTDLIPVIVRGPVGEQYNYLANSISIIKCIDRNGNAIQLENSPSIEMRVTEKNDKRTIFYFDRVFVNDSILYGVQSRFVSSIRRTIKLKDIKKIEIQDGKKNFDYISK